MIILDPGKTSNKYFIDALMMVDSEEEIIKEAEMLAHNQGWTKLKALSVLHSRYLSECGLEEAVRVKKMMGSEESKPKYSDNGVTKNLN